MTVIKPADLKLGDVVCNNASGRFPFGDMEVVKIDSLIGVYLRRPYITEEEECCWIVPLITTAITATTALAASNFSCTQKSVEKRK